MPQDRGMVNRAFHITVKTALGLAPRQQGGILDPC